MDEFYLVLASDADSMMYSGNTSCHFYTPLPHPLLLHGKWRVSLQEISYENTINTIVDEQIQIRTTPAPLETMEKVEEYSFIQLPQKSEYLEIIPKVGYDKVFIKVNIRWAKRNGFVLPLNLEWMPENSNQPTGHGMKIDEGHGSVEMDALKQGFKYVLWGKKIHQPTMVFENIDVTPGSYSTEEALLAVLRSACDLKCQVGREMCVCLGEPGIRKIFHTESTGCEETGGSRQ